jgi:hypothetical protein
MNTELIPHSTPSPDPDGKGNIRIFKSESVLREWLKPQLRTEVYEMVIVHPVQGKIALPDDGTFGKLPQPVRKLPRWSPGDVPLDMRNLKPITTLAPSAAPTAQEQLNGLIKRRSRRRRH